MVDTVPVVLSHQTDSAPLLVPLALLPPEARQEVSRVELQAGLVTPNLQSSARLSVLEAGHTAEERLVVRRKNQ